MRKHMLLEKAFVYPLPKERPKLSGYSFSSDKGYWIREDGIPLVEDHSIPKPRTKKEDVETGEDRKGE